ncbi:hypothetical protein Tco_0641035 [Tanacetum coccineum]
MSNTNNNLQTQTSNALHNAIMEAGGKDRPPMLAPGKYIQWKSRIKRYIDTKSNNEFIHYCLQNPPYKFKWTEKTVLVIEGIYNDIYSTVDACPNACEMWKAIESLKQGESINVQDLETNLYWEFGKFTSRDGASLKLYYSRFYKMMNELSQELKIVSYHKLYNILKQHQNEVNELRAKRLAHIANPLALVAQQQPVYHPQNHPTHYTHNSSTRSQQATTKNKGKAIVNSPPPTYDQEPEMVVEDDALSKEKEIDKLKDLISLSLKKIYKPTNNNLRTSSNTSKANQDNTLRINKGTEYDNQRTVNVVGAKENVEVTPDATDNSGHIFDAELQEVTPNVADNSGPIFDAEPLKKERDLLASLIEKLKCEIDDSKNRNKFLETSNKALVDKLKSKIEDFKTKIKSLESSNNHFKEANNELSKTT